MRINITDGIPRLSWTTDSYFFAPFKVQDGPSIPDTVYEATTLGISVDLDCMKHDIASDETSPSSFVQNYQWLYHPMNDEDKTCSIDVSPHERQDYGFVQLIYFLGPSVTINDSDPDYEYCSASTLLIVEEWNTTASAAPSNQNSLS